MVARVVYADTEALQQAAGWLDIWEVDHAANTFVTLLPSAAADELMRTGYLVTVLAEETAALQGQPLATANQRGGIPGYGCYRTVEETDADLAALAAAHPRLARWVDIGDSWEKATPGGAPGYDLHALILTNHARPGPKPKFVLMAAIHAREYTTAEIATRFAEMLAAGYGVDPDITWLLDYHELHVISHANPDGRKMAEQGYSWRKNTHPDPLCAPFLQGVDLNRNSSFKWNGCLTGSCSSPDPCSLTYRGTGPASEPETQAIEAYLRAQFADQRGPLDRDPAPPESEGLFISLHSYGELILYPWGWTSAPPPNGDALQTLGRKFGYYTGYEVCQVGADDCLYSVDGATDDWAYGELGVAAYTFELGTRFFEFCTTFETVMVEDGLNALRYALKAARHPYRTPAGPEVVDIRVQAPPLNAQRTYTITATADDARYQSQGHGIEPSQAIVAARYTVDAPSWVTETITHAMTVHSGASPYTATLTATIDVTAWPAGRHLLLIEAADADGQWGVPSATFIEVIAPLYLPVIAR